MGERVASHNRLVGLYGHVHQAGNHAACRINLLRIDVRLDVDVVVTLDNHRHFFEGSVSGTLTDTVDGHFHLTRTVQHTRDGVGSRHAEVVVAVGGEDCLVDVIDVLHQVLDFRTVLVGQTVARSIGDVHHRGTRLDDGFHHASQVFVLGTTRILGIKFHIIHITAGILHGSHRTLDDFLTIGVELILDVGVGSTDTRMDSLVLGKAEGIRSHVNVLLHGTGQGTDGGPCHRLGYFNHRIEVARAGDGETRFNHIHAQSLQLLGYLYFLYRIQLTSRHLFAVAERRVENK